MQILNVQISMFGPVRSIKFQIREDFCLQLKRQFCYT